MASIWDTPFWSKDFYDHKARWIHYHNQIRFVGREVAKGGGDLSNFKLLEVGPSHGLVTSYLRKFGVQVTTIDNKKEYNPDVLGSVFDMPFGDNSFDMILVCEVLEHAPYEEFPKALAELYRVSKKMVLLSSPDTRRTLLAFSLKIPFLKQINIFWKVGTKERKMLHDHYWEIGRRNFTLKRVRNSIREADFIILEDRVSMDTPKNHYFLLEKKLPTGHHN